MRGNRCPELAGWILAADQAIKISVERWVPVEAAHSFWGGALALTHVHNTGVALGMLEDAGRWVLAASLAAVAWLFCFWATHVGCRQRSATSEISWGLRSAVRTICLWLSCSALNVWKNSSWVPSLPARNWTSSTRRTSMPSR